MGAVVSGILVSPPGSGEGPVFKLTGSAAGTTKYSVCLEATSGSGSQETRESSRASTAARLEKLVALRVARTVAAAVAGAGVWAACSALARHHSRKPSTSVVLVCSQLSRSSGLWSARGLRLARTCGRHTVYTYQPGWP